MLEVKRIQSGYGKGADVIKSLSLTVKEKEAVTLLGPNGAGKTTLMTTLMGLLPLRAGEIWLAGENISKLPTHERVVRGLVLVPEGRRVFLKMTVKENLLAGGHLQKDAAKNAKNMDRVLGIFPRLAERLSQPAATFSGGEQQMLALARALMSEPKVLLLDEPSMGLAPAIVQQVYGVLGQLVKEGLTVFLVEQNAHVALKVVSRAYVISQGEMVLEDTAENLKGNPEIEKAYLGH